MTSETDLIVPALEALAGANSGQLPTQQLREEIKHNIILSAEDCAPLMNRPDARIDQKIRNLKSHKMNVGNPIFEGLISEIPRGMSITTKGRDFLKSRMW